MPAVPETTLKNGAVVSGRTLRSDAGLPDENSSSKWCRRELLEVAPGVPCRTLRCCVGGSGENT